MRLRTPFAAYSQSSIFKNIVTVFSGTALAQLVQLAGAPLLAHYFTASQFGVFAIYMSLSSLVSIVATLRYEMAVMLVEDDTDARLLARVCMGISLAICLLTAILFYLLRNAVASWFHAPQLINYGWLMPVSVLSVGVFQTYYYQGLRARRFKILSSVKVAQACMFVAFPVLLYYGSFVGSGLILGYVLHQALSVLLIAVALRAWELPSVSFSTIRVRRLLFRYKNLPGINALHAFTDSAQASGINGVLAYCYGDAAVGYYAMAYRLLRAPVGLVGAAVSQVLFQRMSENYNTGKSNYAMFKTVLTWLCAMALPAFATVALCGPWLFNIFLGSEWTEAGYYARSLAPWLFVMFIASPLSHLPNITFRQFQFFAYVLLTNAVAFGTFYVCHLTYHNPRLSLLGFAAAWLIGGAWSLVWFAKLSKEKNAALVSTV